MNVSLDTIVDDVKVCIDEIGPNDSDMLGQQDNAEMASIICSKVVDGVRYVHGNADVSLLDADTVLTTGSDNVSIGSDFVGRVKLPDNFLRLVYARMASWVRYLSEPVYWDDVEYAMLSDPYATGTWERPRLAMVPARTLELYKARDSSDVVQVGIVTEPAVSANGDVRVSDKLYRALVYYVAGLTLLTYKDAHADSMFNQAMVIMGVPPTSN